MEGLLPLAQEVVELWQEVDSNRGEGSQRLGWLRSGHTGVNLEAVRYAGSYIARQEMEIIVRL